MKLWKCGVCGYIHDGEEAPDNCPKCGAAKDKFQALDEAAAELVLKSRVTNDLHMELASLLESVEAIGAEGKDINLDPGCLAIFSEAEKIAKVLKQKIKAEIQTHIGKGKWG